MNTQNLEAIGTGGLGAHNSWVRNGEIRARAGQDIACAHCNKGMSEDNGWLVRWESYSDCLYPFTAEVEGSEIRRLGNECVKNFLTGKEEYAVYAQKVGA